MSSSSSFISSFSFSSLPWLSFNTLILDSYSWILYSSSFFTIDSDFCQVDFNSSSVAFILSVICAECVFMSSCLKPLPHFCLVAIRFKKVNAFPTLLSSSFLFCSWISLTNLFAASLSKNSFLMIQFLLSICLWIRINPHLML